MTKYLLIPAALAFGLAPALAAQPDDPGGFGRDRAAAIQTFQDDDTAPGASEWGAIASQRAGDNGQINQDYAVSNGQLPEGVCPGQATVC